MNAYFYRWLLESRQNCERSREIVPVDSLGSEGRTFVTALSKFYQETDKESAVAIFKDWTTATAKTEKEKEIVCLIYDKALEVDITDKVYQSIEHSLKERYLATEIACHAEAFLNGYDDQALDKIKELVDIVDDFVEVTEAPDDLDTILERTVLQGGVNWRLTPLNQSLGPLRKGDFVIVGARVETGKTTFLASEATHLISQCNGPLLWINNEEELNKVKFRLWQAALGESADWIKANPEQAKALIEPWIGKLVVVEPQFYWEVESLIEQYQPSLIVFDLLDKVEGFKADREDIMYSKMYRWARTLAKKYAPVITSSQCDGEADGRKYLSMTRLDGSRTAKQKEADAIIMIGKDNENEYLRYISVPKNKLAGGEESNEELRHGKFEVLIDPVRARYEPL